MPAALQICFAGDSGCHRPQSNALIGQARIGRDAFMDLRRTRLMEILSAAAFLFATVVVAGMPGTIAAQGPKKTAAMPNATAMPWMDHSLSPDQRSTLVLAQMTQDEKLQLVHGIGWGVLRAGSPVPPEDNGGAGFVAGIKRCLGTSRTSTSRTRPSAFACPPGAARTLLHAAAVDAGRRRQAGTPPPHFSTARVIGRELRARRLLQHVDRRWHQSHP